MSAMAHDQQVVEWSTGLCGCLRDPSSCCLTWFCPCISFGRIVEIVEKGEMSCLSGCCIYMLLMYIGVPCLFSFGYRRKLRQLYSLEKEPCDDFFVHCLCGCCALSQEYRELKRHGLHPSKGWARNADKWNEMAKTTPPVVTSSMSR